MALNDDRTVYHHFRRCARLLPTYYAVYTVQLHLYWSVDPSSLNALLELSNFVGLSVFFASTGCNGTVWFVETLLWSSVYFSIFEPHKARTYRFCTLVGLCWFIPPLQTYFVSLVWSTFFPSADATYQESTNPNILRLTILHKSPLSVIPTLILCAQVSVALAHDHPLLRATWFRKAVFIASAFAFVIDILLSFVPFRTTLLPDWHLMYEVLFRPLMAFAVPMLKDACQQKGTFWYRLASHRVLLSLQIFSSKFAFPLYMWQRPAATMLDWVGVGRQLRALPVYFSFLFVVAWLSYHLFEKPLYLWCDSRLLRWSNMWYTRQLT